MRATTVVLVFLAILTAVRAHAQALENADFEQGRGVAWQEWSKAGDALIATGDWFHSSDINPPVVPRSGQWMARLGGFNYNENTLTRMVTLPNTKPLYLGFFYQSRTASHSECGGLWVGAQIRIAVANQLVFDGYLCHYNDVHEWVSAYIDVGAVAGQTVQVVFRADAASSVWSYLYLDDFMVTTSTTVGVEGEVVALHDVDLAQNYPNPFDAETAIRFSLSRPQAVRLTVYDVLGREVAVLLDEQREAGEHAVNFDAGHLPGGLYMYRIEADGAVRTRWMTLAY